MVQSILVGTAALTLIAAISVVLVIRRGGISSPTAMLRSIAVVAVACQAAHFAEEAVTGFGERFPALLGLAAWPRTFFLGFNLSWLAIWVASIAGVSTMPRMAAFALWFLAIAATANGIVHPLLALATGGYFPGAWTAPILGVAGVLLWRSLAIATGARVRRG